MYAVVETGGKQYQVEKGTTLLVDRLKADEGAKVDLRAVAFRDKELVLGSDLEKVKVEAKVAGHERGPEDQRLQVPGQEGLPQARQGHRSELTRLEVTEIKMLQRNRPANAGGRQRAPPDYGGDKKPAARPREGDEGWLIRRDSARAETAATPNPKLPRGQGLLGPEVAAARSSCASAAPASAPATASASAATTRSSRPDADAVAGPEAGAALADDDLAAVDPLAGEDLDPEHLRVRVAAIAAGSESLLMSHPSSPYPPPSQPASSSPP